jgi:hypothetical protein
MPTIPSVSFAKAKTSKIIIKGADLSVPIEIKDTRYCQLSYLDEYWGGLYPDPGMLYRKYTELHR